MPEDTEDKLPTQDEIPGLVRSIAQQIRSFKGVFRTVLDLGSTDDNIGIEFWKRIRAALAYAVAMETDRKATDAALAWVGKHIHNDTDDTLDWIVKIHKAGTLDKVLETLRDINKDSDITGVVEWARLEKKAREERRVARGVNARTFTFIVITGAITTLGTIAVHFLFGSK
jgi:hypothetical protein